MIAFRDHALRARPHIAVLGADKVGNFVVITPLLRGLKHKYQGCTIDYFGSRVTRQLELACPYIDWRCSVYGHGEELTTLVTEVKTDRTATAGPYDLAVNCDGFSEITAVVARVLEPRFIAGAVGIGRAELSGDDPIEHLLRDDHWDDPEFVERHRGTVESNYIAEVLCRLAYVDTDFFELAVAIEPPTFQVPDVLIHMTATRSAKMWPVERWHAVVRWCAEQGLTVGLVGSTPSEQRRLYCSDDAEAQLLRGTSLIDLRGRTTLLELAGALRQARALVTVDTGPLHIAASVDCPTVAIFGNDEAGMGSSPMRLWLPRRPHVVRTISSVSCSECASRRHRNASCLLDTHACMGGVSVDHVIGLLSRLLA